MGGALPSAKPVSFTKETPSASILKTTPEDVPVSKAAGGIMREDLDAWIDFSWLAISPLEGEMSDRTERGAPVANRADAGEACLPNG